MFCKYQVDVLTGGQVTLGDILLCGGLLSYFMEVLYLNLWHDNFNINHDLCNFK